MSQHNIIETLISISGILYFVLWSASFYGPILTLYREKTALGVDSNYVFINISGYFFYAFYNAYGFVKKSNYQTGNVFFGDILYSIHCILLYSIFVALYFYYPHKIALNRYTKIYTITGWTLFIIYGIYFVSTEASIFIFGFEFGFIRMLGCLNTTSSLLKHPPQIYYNFMRKSTKGWDITSRLLDFGGGLFSFLQIFLLSLIDQNFQLNWAKFFLAILSMIYDIIYIIQHYILYKNNRNVIDIRYIDNNFEQYSSETMQQKSAAIQLNTLESQLTIEYKNLNQQFK